MTKPEFTGPALCALPARDVVAMLKSGEICAADALDAAFERIGKVEPMVNATVTVCEDRARKAAKNLGPIDPNLVGGLAGLPIAIKDLNLVKGVRTTFGNLAMKDFIPEESDPLVMRLEERGGIVVGKTNTPEFGAGGNTFNDVFGYTRNPWDTRKNSGGSSGGAAVSVATGEVWLSHGSDLAGSLRTPGAYCGVIGMRPSPGRAGGGPEATGFMGEGLSGPMARDIQDTALFLDALSGFDPIWPMSFDAPITPFQEAVAQADGRVRIGFSEDQNGFAPVEPEIRQILREAMGKVERAGGVVEEACPELPNLEKTYVTLRGQHYGAVSNFLPDHVRAHFKPTLKGNIAVGANQPASAIYEAQRDRTVLYHKMRQFLENYDVLAIPVVGLEPGPVEVEYPPFVDGVAIGDYVEWLKFSYLAVVTTLPCLSMPVGFTASGMPVGLQLIGPPRGEAKLLQVARAVEDAVGFPIGPIDPIVR